MHTPSKNLLAEFLSSYPLYRKYDISTAFLSENRFRDPKDFCGLTFNFFCKKERREHTFEIIPANDNDATRFGRPAFGFTSNIHIEHLDKDGRVFYSHHYKCLCTSCKEYHLEILLNVFSENPLVSDVYERAISEYSIKDVDQEAPVFVRKVGQYPLQEVKPKKDIKNYLTAEDQEHYQKALMCLSQNYGIGAFAYFRRILENEIRRIAKDISELNFEGADQMKQAYLKFERDHQMKSLIESIDKYLPANLKIGSINPISILYAQLSGGIHQFTEEECTEKASSIDTILGFLIKKINEEKYELNEVQSALKNLNKN